ncbi:hypothetical protein HY449_00385 [Candidatus Pacearchaeota archaeon]|nr:hypothetical protein [Candidatus Pacearchaeota archaeon]
MYPLYRCRVPQPPTPEELAERKRKSVELQNYYNTPEGRAELKSRLDKAAEEVRGALGLTGNPQYDIFIKRAEHAEWWHSVKDRPFTI